MAARRLIFILLGLLALSTVIAALLPPQPSGDKSKQDQRSGATGTGTTGSQNSLLNPDKEPAPVPGLVRARIEVSNSAPKTIRVEPGDRLVLSVDAGFGDDVEIPAFGLTETMTPYSPAVFDLIVRRPGTYPIMTVESNRVVGQIVSTVEPPPAPAAPENPDDQIA